MKYLNINVMSTMINNTNIFGKQNGDSYREQNTIKYFGSAGNLVTGTLYR